MNTKVSVVITTCRRSPSYIIRALKSVMNQTYKNIDIIVVDDSPADFYEKTDVKLAVMKACPNACYISFDKNCGAPVARNAGMKAAKGEYIAFLDDDDEWLPQKIEHQLAGFTDNDTSLVYSKCYVRDDINETQSIDDRGSYNGDVFGILLEKGNFIGSTSIPLIRKQYLKEIGGFDESMKSYQDYDVYLRLAQKHKINYVSETDVIYHKNHGSQITNSFENTLQGRKRIIDKYNDELKRNSKAWAFRYRELIPLYRINGNVLKALKIWLATARKIPFDVGGNVRHFVFAVLSPDFPLLRFRRYVRLKMHKAYMRTKGKNTNRHEKNFRF